MAPRPPRSPKHRAADQRKKLDAINAALHDLSAETRRALARVVWFKEDKYPNPHDRQLAGYLHAMEAAQQTMKEWEALAAMVERAHRLLVAKADTKRTVWDQDEVLACVWAFWVKTVYGESPKIEPPAAQQTTTVVPVIEVKLQSRVASGELQLVPGDEYRSAIEALQERYGLKPSEIALWALHETGDDLPVSEKRIKLLAGRIRSITLWRKRHARALPSFLLPFQR
jgi:hypothetical protein